MNFKSVSAELNVGWLTSGLKRYSIVLDAVGGVAEPDALTS